MAGKFLNNPQMKRLMPTDPEFALDPKKPWKLMEDLRYQSGVLIGEVILVPAGFRTDFASVPWLFRRPFPKDGPWTHAAIVHDFLCDKRPPYANSYDACEIFDEAMDALLVHRWQRAFMCFGVFHFGPKW